MLRNSPWGKAFVDHWLFLSTKRNKYQFTDNGPFAETVLRFGSNDLPSWSNCSYSRDYCYNMMTKKSGKGNGKEYVICLGKIKAKLTGDWNRTEHRDMGTEHLRCFCMLFFSSLECSLTRNKLHLLARQAAFDSCPQPLASTPMDGKLGNRGAGNGSARLSLWTACSFYTTRTSKSAFQRLV